MNLEPNQPMLLSRKQAADSMAISIRKLDSLVASRRLPVVRIDSSVRFDPADLAAFVERSRKGGDNEL